MNMFNILRHLNEGLKDCTPQELVTARDRVIKFLDVMLQESVLRTQKQRLIEEDSEVPDIQDGDHVVGQGTYNAQTGTHFEE
jgi:hypothetical protein